jgi:hypothetical protein
MRKAPMSAAPNCAFLSPFFYKKLSNEVRSGIVVWRGPACRAC